MTTSIDINGNSYERIMYRGEPVITLPMVARIHERNLRTANRNFSRNRDKFIEGEDYFLLPYEEWKEFLSARHWPVESEQTARQIMAPNDLYARTHGVGKRWGGCRIAMYFFTMNGYLLLVKSMNDPLAWKVQRTLVNKYFSDSPFKRRCKYNQQSIAEMKALRTQLREERLFHTLTLSEANRILKNGGVGIESLSHSPKLQDAVVSILRTDPRAKQLNLFGDSQ